MFYINEMKAYCLKIVVILVFALGCQKQRVQNSFTPTNYNKRVGAKISLDSLSIPISKEQLPFYKTSFFYLEKDSLFYLGFNNYRSTIDVFKILPKPTIYKSIDLRRVNGAQDLAVKALFVHNLDSIFVFNENADEILLISKNNKLINRYDLNTRYNELFHRYPLHVSAIGGQFLYDKARNQMIVRANFLSETSQNKFAFKNNLGEYPLACIDLSTLKMNMIDFPIPREYSRAYYIGLNNAEFYLQSDGILIGTYPINSNIYTLDMFEGEGRTFGANSKFNPPSVSNLDPQYLYNQERVISYIDYSAKYFYTTADASNNLKFRLHSTALDLTHRNVAEAMKNKKLYLTIMDKAFSIIGDFSIPPRGLNNYYFVAFKNKIIIPQITHDKRLLVLKVINYTVK